MALGPDTLRTERAKISQFEISGTIISSKLVEKDPCINKYESVLNTGSENISFQYSTYGDVLCTVDSIYDIELNPFIKGTTITASLTQEEPHLMISTDIHFIPETKTGSLSYILIVGLLILLSASIIFLIKKKHTKRDKN